MNPEEKSPIEKALEILKKAVANRDEIVVEGFVQLGPDQLRQCLEMEANDDWQRFFDYLVLNKGVVKHCVRKYMDFFYSVVATNGPMAIRKIFKIKDAKYDSVFEEIFDLVAISNGALYKYVEENRFEFALVVRSGKADGLRQELGLQGKRYQSLWMEILQLLIDSVCDEYYDEKVVEQGIATFDFMMNSLRKHRSLRSNRKMWEYSTLN